MQPQSDHSSQLFKSYAVTKQFAEANRHGGRHWLYARAKNIVEMVALGIGRTKRVIGR
jgi:hypothetical protein